MTLMPPPYCLVYAETCLVTLNGTALAAPLVEYPLQVEATLLHYRHCRLV